MKYVLDKYGLPEKNELYNVIFSILVKEEMASVKSLAYKVTQYFNISDDLTNMKYELHPQ